MSRAAIGANSLGVCLLCGLLFLRTFQLVYLGAYFAKITLICRVLLEKLFLDDH